MSQWVAGTLFDNIDKFATALGYDNAGVILPLATIPWQSPTDRDAFIATITGKPPVAMPDNNMLSEASQKVQAK
jgi:hypothetical protein